MSSEEEEVGAEEGEEEEVEAQEEEDEEGAIDDKASESGSESEEEEEGLDEFEKDDFIVDEEEEEEAASDSADSEQSDQEDRKKKKKSKKKKSKRRLSDDDDDDDIPRESKGGRLKRLKKAVAVTGAAHLADIEDDVAGTSTRKDKGGRTVEQLKQSLFGEDDGFADEAVDAPQEDEDEEDEDEDEMGDFIVEEEEDEHGQMIKKKKKKKKGASSGAVHEMQDLFGADDEIQEMLERAARHASGARTGAARDGDEDDGDDDERGRGSDEDEGGDKEGAGRGRGRDRRKNKALAEASRKLDPAIVAQGFLTQADEDIRNADVPERMQLLDAELGPPPGKDRLEEEASWIYRHAFAPLADAAGLYGQGGQGGPAILQARDVHHAATSEPSDVVACVASALSFMHVERMEVPFIAMYRKEEVGKLLDPDDLRDQLPAQDGQPIEPTDVHVRRWLALWMVEDWDIKWRRLQRRKQQLSTLYQTILQNVPEDMGGGLVGAEAVTYLDGLETAATEAAVEDLNAKFNLRFTKEVAAIKDGGGGEEGYKRPARRTYALYQLCHHAGLKTLAADFAISEVQYGKHMQKNYRSEEPVDPFEATPEKLAETYQCDGFPTPAAVLKGVVHLLASEVAAEPLVRSAVRESFFTKATVTTRPTQAGQRVVDAFHRFGPVKWLKDKPLSAFKSDGSFLDVLAAERQGLIKVTLGVPDDLLAEDMKEWTDLYTSDSAGEFASLWNEQRTAVIVEAIKGRLLPAMEREARVQLAAEAREFVASAIGDELWRLACMAPHGAQLVDPVSGDVVGQGTRAMAGCWGPGDPATTFVVIDNMGELADLLYAGYIANDPDNLGPDERPRRDRARLLTFCSEQAPHVCVLGAADMQATKLYNVVANVLEKWLDESARTLPWGMDNRPDLVWADETLPRLFENSSAAVKELADYPPIVRRAVGLGRQLQNPLALIANLCAPAGVAEPEILFLRLHALQEELPREMRLRAVERVMVTLVNQVGAEINAAVAHPWLASCLQFVGGLGPRKAAALVQSVTRAGGRAESRRTLIADLGMGRTVFMNAAGALRVAGDDDPLDGTRIHPEAYDFAMKMAFDAVHEGEDGEAETAEAYVAAVDKAMRRPDALLVLEISSFAASLQTTLSVNKLNTFFDIRLELTFPGHERRFPWRALSPRELYFLLSGESEESVREGRPAQALVRNVFRDFVIVEMEGSRAHGKVHKDDLNDNPVSSCDHVQRGQMLHVRVKQLVPDDNDLARWTLMLTSQGQLLRDNLAWERRLSHADRFYEPDEELVERLKEEARLASKVAATSRLDPDSQLLSKKKIEKRATFTVRPIVHPLFKNVSSEEAMHRLRDANPGDVIVRPSTQGLDKLSLTMKFDQLGERFLHLNIHEGGKPAGVEAGKASVAALRLGSPLTIGNSSFEDLDDVMYNYVEPYGERVRECVRHRKFRPGDPDEVARTLQADRAKNPNMVAYALGVTRKPSDNKFALYYIYSNSVHHESVMPTTGGFLFREKNFNKLDDLFAWWKRHMLPTGHQRGGQQQPSRAPTVAIPQTVPPPPPNGGGYGQANGSGGGQGGAWSAPASSAWAGSSANLTVWGGGGSSGAAAAQGTGAGGGVQPSGWGNATPSAVQPSGWGAGASAGSAPAVQASGWGASPSAATSGGATAWGQTASVVQPSGWKV